MKKPADLDWKRYEEITKYIYETLGRQSGVKIKGYGNSCKVTGKTGVDYQIDVLTTHSDGIHEYQTAIECKYWKEKINRDIVMKVYGIIEDTGINKGIVVSKSGFTQDAIEYAKYKDIGLVELREAEERDLGGETAQVELGILELRTEVTIRRPEILGIAIDSIENSQIEKQSWINKYLVKLSNGSQVAFADYIKEFQNELHFQNKEWQFISKHYEVPGARLINEQATSSVSINVITFAGVLMKIDKSSNLRITLVDQVWLILKFLFEKRTFSFSENGILIEKQCS